MLLSRRFWRPAVPPGVNLHHSGGGSFGWTCLKLAVFLTVFIGLLLALSNVLIKIGTAWLISGNSASCDCALCHHQVTIPIQVEPIPNPPELIQLPCPISEREGVEPFKKFIFREQNEVEVNALVAKREKWSSTEWEHQVHSLMESNLEGKYVITAVANIGHANFTLNWIASLKRMKYDRFVIFCLDFQLYKLLLLKGFERNAVMAPLSWTKHQIPALEHKWLEVEYNRLTEAKIRIQRELLYKGYWILFSDVDVVFLSRHVVDHVDFVIGRYCGEAMPTQCFTDFVYMYDQDTDINTGFFAARPTETVKQAFDRSIRSLSTWKVDQLALNYVIRTEMKAKYSKNFRGLDKFLYANGFIYFRLGASKIFDIKPLVVHANYVQGSADKQKLLESGQMWFI